MIIRSYSVEVQRIMSGVIAGLEWLIIHLL